MLSALFAIIANVSFGVTMVCLNSYLPQMARSDATVQAVLLEAQDADQHGLHGHSGDSGTLDDGYESDERAPLHREDEYLETREVNDPMTSDEYNQALSRATSRISSRGIAIGYSAGITLLLALLVPVILLKGSTFSLRLSIW